jgi:hypothetical protein
MQQGQLRQAQKHDVYERRVALFESVESVMLATWVGNVVYIEDTQIVLPF